MIGAGNLFLIGDIPGFTPQIARLVSMMNYVRSTTLKAVAGLALDELDYLHDPQSNSIGTLLSHRHYVAQLQEVRAKTLAELGRRDDRWLEEETSFGAGTG